MPSVSIIVPTYNEAENVDLLLERIFAVPALRSFDVEVLFSDGASTDETCHRVERWMKTHRVRLVRSQVNEGLSAAVMAGARAATGEFAVVIDADLSHPPEVIPELLAPLMTGECDMTIGSRYAKGGGTPEWPFARRLSSRLATLTARLLTDVKDPLAGFIAVRRERLAAMNREVCGFKFGLELLATSGEYLHVKEIPILFRDRCHGISKMSLQVVVDYCHQLLILAGITLLPEKISRLAPLLFLFLAVDCTVLTVLLEDGMLPGAAHGYSLAAAVMLSGSVLLYRIMGRGISVRRLVEYVFGYLWVALLTLLLRSGLVALLLVDNGLTPGGILSVGLFGLGITYIATVCYVVSIGRKRIGGPLVQRFYAIGAFLYLLLLRLIYFSSVPVLPEEVQYQLLFAQLQGILFDPAVAVGGGSEVLADLKSDNLVTLLRFGVWLLWLCSAACVFSLARIMFDRSTAFMSCLLFGALPGFFGMGLFVSGDVLLLFFWTCGLYLLYRLLVDRVKRGWIIAGVVMGLGIQANVQLSALLAAVVVYLLIYPDERKWLSKPALYLALGVVLLSSIPSFFLLSAGKTMVGNTVSWVYSLFGDEVAGSLLLAGVLLTPTGLLAGGHALWMWLCQAVPSLGGGDVSPARGRKFVLTMFFLPMLLLLLPELYGAGSPATGGVAWLVLLPAMARTIGRRVAEPDRVLALLTAIWWPTIGILLAVYGVSLHLAVL